MRFFNSLIGFIDLIIEKMHYTKETKSSNVKSIQFKKKTLSTNVYLRHV